MPTIAPDKLAERLARGKAIPAIVLLGTDPYLRDLCRNQIIEAIVPEGARDWAITRVSASSGAWDEVFQRAETLPMLAPRQVVIVDDVESVEKLGDKSREAIVEAVEKYLASPAPFTVLLLEAGALDGRQRFAKLLVDKALIVELSIGNESAASLAVQMAGNLGVEIDREAAALLADILNGEPARIRIELEKLAAYVHGRGRITSADVEALVVAARKNTVWEFADMLATRKRASALEFLENLLREGEQPIAILGAVAARYRILIKAREMPPSTPGFRAASFLGMGAQFAETAVRQAHLASKGALLAGLVALAEADSQLKSSNPNPRATMEFLVARLTSEAIAGSAARA
jgi:DNA polymerase III subunit delta